MSVSAAENEPFIFEVKSEPKTVGDIKPAFIVYKDKPLPKVSVNYVLKKYIKLFESANSPAVKIDAINRINNLRAKYKLGSKKLTIDKVIQSEVVLDSYDKIIDSGVFYQRMDELLYQTAKATKFVGNDKESVKRLKLLVGLYPRSNLVDESMFRMAESYFEMEEFAKAEGEYKKILAFSTDKTFHQQARFKLGWSVFRLERFKEAGQFALNVLDDFPGLKGLSSIEQLDVVKQDLVDDTLRLLSILFSKQQGAKSIETLLADAEHKHYAYLLYDSLFHFYLKQDRFQDAAVVALAYTEYYPTAFNAYKMATNAIDSYKHADFEIQTWETKEIFVKRFGVESAYWATLNDSERAVVRPLVVENLNELAHLYFIRMQAAFDVQGKIALSAQSSGQSKDESALIKTETSYQAYGQLAADYYLQLASARKQGVNNGQNLYLAAEALFKIGKYQKAINTYERAAYESPGHASAVKAGYAAILTYDNLAKTNKNSKALTPSLKVSRQESILRFAKYFPQTKYTPSLLNELANELYAEKQYILAETTSQRAVSMKGAAANIVYSSWLVNAHSNFELKQFSKSEYAYQQLLTLKPEKDRDILRERLAASVYKQAENTDVMHRSAELYLKVVDLVPEASIVPQSLFDASTLFLQLKKWQQAIATLNVFQERFPQHKLYDDASDKLVHAYIENKEPVSAAEKLVEISLKSKDVSIASNALYRAAEIYDQNDFQFEAMQLFTDFVKRYKVLFELNVEAQSYVIAYYQLSNNLKQMQKLQENLITYEKVNISKRTARSSFLASNAALSLAIDKVEGFEKLKLSLPLKKSLVKKKASLEKLVKSFEALAEYEVPEVLSAATYQIGLVYRTLAQDLLTSERPTSLTELQLEQYNILLEEQAYPFEEQAIDILKINTAKVPEGEYDQWIKKTYEVLEVINPTEFKRQAKEVEYAEQVY